MWWRQHHGIRIHSTEFFPFHSRALIVYTFCVCFCASGLLLFDVEWLKASIPFHCYELMQPNWIWKGPQNAVKQSIQIECVWTSIFFSFYCYRAIIIWCCYSDNVRRSTLFRPSFLFSKRYVKACRQQTWANLSFVYSLHSEYIHLQRHTESNYLFMGEGSFVICDSSKRTKLYARPCHVFRFSAEQQALWHNSNNNEKLFFHIFLYLRKTSKGILDVQWWTY